MWEVVGVVESWYPLLALLVSDGYTPSDCFLLPGDAAATFERMRSRGGHRFLASVLGRRCGAISWDRFETQLEAIERHGTGVVGWRDRRFPGYLRDIQRPPVLLFYRGRIETLHARGVAIVGTRKPSARGVAFARSLARDLSAAGVMIASGLAHGIDTAAHRGTLEGGAPAVGVLGAGLDLPYPRENTGLIEEMTESGCVFSDQPMGTPPSRFTFPNRNRLISAVSRAVVVVEAGERSGARITARWALEQGRDVGAVPGFPGDFRSRGVNALLRDGAFLVESAQDIFDAVPLLATASVPAGRDERVVEDGGDGIEVAGVDAALVHAILARLSNRPTDPDSLARQLEVESATVGSVLSALEIEGKIGVDMLGCYYVL